MDNQVSQYQSLPGNMLYNNLISNIEQGQIKIPQFQRKFVWSIEETAGLIDSILKGYPIGTFIDAYRKAVQTYQFSKIDVKNAPIEVATEIFTRINIGGKPLTLFEIMIG